MEHLSISTTDLSVPPSDICDETTSDQHEYPNDNLHASRHSVNDNSESESPDTRHTPDDLPEVCMDDPVDLPTPTISTVISNLPSAAEIHGCTLRIDGLVYDANNHVTGKLVEGLPWMLEGCTVGFDGQVVSEERVATGRAVPLPMLKNPITIEGTRVVDRHFRIVGRAPREHSFQKRNYAADEYGRVFDDGGACVGYVELYRDRELTPDELELMPSLQGLELSSDGVVYDRRDNPVAHLITSNANIPEGCCLTKGGELRDGGLLFHGPPCPRIAPLPAAEQALEYESLKGLQFRYDGRVRDRKNQTVARLRESTLERPLEHSKTYLIRQRGEIVDEDYNVIGLVDLLDRESEHSPSHDCLTNCFDCTSLKFESLPYDQQVDLFVECTGLQWKGWPSEQVTPRVGLYRYVSELGILKHEFRAGSTSDIGDQLLGQLHLQLWDESTRHNVCVIENVDRCLAERLGRFGKIPIDFFFEHYRTPQVNNPDDNTTWERHSYSKRRGTLQGYFHYSDQRIHRQLAASSATQYLSARLSYYLATDLLILILVDAASELQNVCASDIAWGEWRFCDSQQAPETIHIPLTYGSKTLNLFDVMNEAFVTDTTVLSTIFEPHACLNPNILYALSTSVVVRNLDLLEDAIKRISFIEIQEPETETNQRLHDRREDLHYAKAKVHVLERLLWEEYGKPKKIGGQVQLPSEQWTRIQKALEHVSRIDRFLMETFQLLISSLSTQDNHRNFEQSRRTNLVTLLAFIYVPLSLVTGIFGMNVKSVNGSPLPYWVCFITLAIVLVFTLALWGVHRLWEHRKDLKKAAQRRKREKMV